MKIIPVLLKELDNEVQLTRQMFAQVPEGKYNWRPHLKSMNIKDLVTHIADLPSWVTLALTTDELDFAVSPYHPKEVQNNADLLAAFEQAYVTGRKHLSDANESALTEGWILRNGDYVIKNYTRLEAIRVALNQLTHHRAQLGVDLRLLDIFIPGSYGPSADELEFQASLK